MIRGLHDLEALPVLADVVGLLLCAACVVLWTFLAWALMG